MLGMYGLGTQELIIAGVVLVVLVFAPFLFAFARAGFRHPLLTAIPVSIAMFLVVALAAGFTGVNALAILAIIAIAAIVYGFSRSVIRTSDSESNAASRKASSAANEASTLDEAQPTYLSEDVSGQVAEKASVEIPLSPSTSGPSAPIPLLLPVSRLFARGREACAKRPEILELAAFFAMVGSLMLIGVLFQGIITPTHMGKYQFDVNRGASVEQEGQDSTKGAGVGQVDEREQAIIDRHKKEMPQGSLLQGIAQARADEEIGVRRQQRAYAEQAAPEMVKPAREMLSNLGDRNEVLGILRQMTPEQREEALRVAPGVGQQMGDDRVVVFARCVAAFSRGVTHGWVNPIMELVGIGGTEKEIQFIRQLDEIATQEFHPYRPGNPWFERVPLQAIEMLPWVFVIGGLIFIAYRWKARSAQTRGRARRFSSSGPSAPRPLMWQAGRVFALSKDVCTERPEFLLIPAFIATAGILFLIEVMSGTSHTEQTSSKNDRLAEQIEAGKPPIGVSPETFEQLKNAAKERFEQLPGVTEHQRTFEQLIVDWVDDHQGQPLPEQHVMSGWIQEMRAELRSELIASPEAQAVLARMEQVEDPEGPESAALQHELESLTQQWMLRRMDARKLLDAFERKYQRWLQDSQEVNAPAAAQEPRNPFQEFTGASSEARSHYLRGLAAAHSQEDFESAVQQFTEAIRIDPNYAEAYVARGCARLHNFNEHDLAIEDHTKAIGLQPDYALAYLHRADTYWDEGRNHEALNDCNKAISLSPSFAHTFWLRSQVLTELEEHERAKFDLERAKQLGFVGDGRWYPWHDVSWQYWQTLKLKDFSIEIPDGWISASGPELREYEKLMKSRTGMSKSYDFGTQPSGRHVYFMEPPFILGIFKPDEKNTDKEIEAMAEPLNKQFQSTDPSDRLDSDSAVLKYVFDNSTFQRPYLDVDTKCIYSTISTQTPAYGLVHAVTIQRLSPHGKVILSAYVSDETKEEQLGIINWMISSISFLDLD
jgi:tetratricopeptide (TPR) repeat protein